MPALLVDYLSSQPVMQVIRGLLQSAQPRHLRELASECSLSPAGVSDVIRRLKETGVLKEFRKGNKRYLFLSLNEEELKCMKHFFTVLENSYIEKRAPRFSKGAAQKLEWMDEAFEFYRDVKRGKRDSS